MTIPNATVRGMVLSVSLALSTVVPIFGQSSPLWGNLKPGPFGVGFKTIEFFDYSRTFQPARDYFGTPVEGETARPIQVCYWYPAVPSGGTGMVYSEYAFPYPADSRLFTLLSELQNRELGTIYAFTRGNFAMVAEIMNYPLMAVRDATPAAGAFPLIVYHGNGRSAYSQNAVLCEYLASQGFVVATTHSVGATTPNPTDQPADVESVVRDKELVVAAMHELSQVDAKKLGLIGYDYGATTALIHQMRNYAVTSVATLQGRYLTTGGGAALFNNASYDSKRMQAAWLQMYTESPAQPADLSLLDSLHYCKRYSVVMPQARPLEFSVYGLMAAELGVDSTRTLTAATEAYSGIAQYLGKFFDATLNNNTDSWTWLEKTPVANGFASQNMTLKVRTADDVPPTSDQFLAIVQNQGIARAKEVCDQFKLPTPENPILSDATFTQMGYQFLQRGNISDAVQVFAWGVAAWPTSANAWDSYGEACAAGGDPVTALANYRKALEILQSDAQINPAMRTQLQTSIPANIQRLEQEVAARGKSGSRSQ